MDTIKVIITGASGMVGKGVLLECLDDKRVASVLVITRKPIGLNHTKLIEVIHEDFMDVSPLRDKLRGYDTCFFCLGVSAVGMSEEQYTRITYSLTVNFARALLTLNPETTFTYVSGTGTDSTERGSAMWARVKGRTENEILNMGFKDAYAFRPGIILPEKGVRSSTGWYNALYVVARPFFPLLRKLKSVTTSSRVGLAMISVALNGHPKKHLENDDINAIARTYNPA